ncbi:MAG: ATP-binding cassette domain-containing protein [Deltaproteobacteria bacterium]|nr:ATP-binding cassette domain-containing protein [Candidatus Zymogenaceae bacterium]
MIRTDKLTMRFNGFVAVDKVSFSVGEGELFGFLGPNGAGKTTTIKMLTTLLPPSGGRGWVAGHDIVTESDAVRDRIGIIFQDPSLDERLTATENLFFHAILYGIGRKDAKARIDKALAMVELKGVKDKVVKTFSGGMKRRLEIARGFLHMPSVLFLDEPTLGLDPQTRRVIWEYIRGLKETFGVTLFLTTHYMEEAEHSDRIGIIHKGKLIRVDTPENLKKALGGSAIALRATDDNVKKLANADIDAIREDSSLIVKTEQVDETIKRMVEIGADMMGISVRQPTLEDVFIDMTGSAIGEESGDAMGVMRAAVRMRRMR